MTACECKAGLPECSARALAQELKKFLLAKGMWHSYEEINEPDLKLIRVGVTIKVKQ
jgi:hypothetical protein